jgi:hypothetical protein
MSGPRLLIRLSVAQTVDISLLCCLLLSPSLFTISFALFLVPRAGSVDALMESMKTQCPSLSGVYERSDAMLAVYPGEGARFAKHIDNTTGACAAVCLGHFALLH